MTLYYETLCPDCRQFVSTQLWSAFEAIGSIMNLTLVPYGNAKETYRQVTNFRKKRIFFFLININFLYETKETKLWQFTCQHGSEECWGIYIH